MPSHRLDPLLRPRSIAVLGASERPGTVGCHVLANLRRGGYPGRLYAINPNRKAVAGLPCYAGLDALPERVEHVVFALADTRVEAALEGVIAHGAKAATLFSSLYLDGDAQPPIAVRVRRRVCEAGLLVCGANGMGFYNVRDRIWACGFDARVHEPPGEVTLISHSGAGMCGIVDCEERLRFNLAVSTGQELSVGMDDYIDFALTQPETRAIGLFVETARNPDGLVAAFDKAAARRVPVIALKVGRTTLAARVALTHSGALAGSDAAYDALFDRYGVQRVADMDELACALILCAQPRAVAAGGLVAVHDSGGEQQLLIDLAEEMDVPLATPGPHSIAALEAILDPGLAAVNPLDAWSRGGPDAGDIVQESLAILLRDESAAMAALVHDRAPGSGIYPEYLAYLRHASVASGKPVCLVANRQGSGADPQAVEATAAGLPVLDGLRPFLAGVRCRFGHRDFLNRGALTPPGLDATVLAKWRAGLAGAASVSAETAVGMLAELGLPLNPQRVVSSAREALDAAHALGFPVVAKTATPGIAHKTEYDGVRLDLRDDLALLAAWEELSSRLGPQVAISPMRCGGTEMLLGSTLDPQFGPLVVMGAGGIHAEALPDSVSLLAPFDAVEAGRRLKTLRIWPVLRGVRGAAPADVAAFCAAAARLSVIAAALRDEVAGIDLNPVLLSDKHCIAVDALVIPARAWAGGRTHES